MSKNLPLTMMNVVKCVKSLVFIRLMQSLTSVYCMLMRPLKVWTKTFFKAASLQKCSSISIILLCSSSSAPAPAEMLLQLEILEVQTLAVEISGEDL